MHSWWRIGQFFVGLFMSVVWAFIVYRACVPGYGSETIAVIRVLLFVLQIPVPLVLLLAAVPGLLVMQDAIWPRDKSNLK